jgi:hypothetical protein
VVIGLTAVANGASQLCAWVAPLIAQQPRDARNAGAAIAALAGLILLAMFLLVFIALAGRWARRYGKISSPAGDKLSAKTRTGQEDWWRKSLVESSDNPLPEDSEAAED